jgi:hypothetical protein
MKLPNRKSKAVPLREGEESEKTDVGEPEV